MSMTADQIVDRRRLRRKLAFWRFAGIVAIVVAVAGLAMLGASGGSFSALQPDQIARVSVEGFIVDDRKRDALLEKLAESEAVKAVIVAIDSTGGVTAGGEALYEGLKEVADAKPTVAAIGTVGASAAYMAALATDRIVARRASITGSIGVLFQYPKIGELMDNIGVDVEEVKSSPLKAAPSPFAPTDPAARAVIAGLVRDSYDWFVGIVAEERGFSRAEALRLADGRVYSGRQALEANLIDEIGGEDAAIAWLADEHGIDPDLPVRDWKPAADSDVPVPFARAALVWIAERVGLPAHLLGGDAIDRLIPDSLLLDGLISVWQGSGGGGDIEGAR